MCMSGFLRHGVVVLQIRSFVLTQPLRILATHHCWDLLKCHAVLLRVSFVAEASMCTLTDGLQIV